MGTLLKNVLCGIILKIIYKKKKRKKKCNVLEMLHFRQPRCGNFSFYKRQYFKKWKLVLALVLDFSKKDYKTSIKLA